MEEIQRIFLSVISLKKLKGGPTYLGRKCWKKKYQNIAFLFQKIVFKELLNMANTIYIRRQYYKIVYSQGSICDQMTIFGWCLTLKLQSSGDHFW